MILRLAQFFRLSRRELIALVAVFVVSMPAVTTRLYSSDEVQYYSYLRSLWFDHDVSFENEYRYFFDHDIAQSAGFHETFLERRTAAGRRINYATMGCALLWAPFYGIADVAVRIGVFGGGVPADGFSRPYVAAAAYASALCGFVAVLLSIRAARIVTGTGVVAGVAVWLGTPLLFYMYVAPPFAHASSAFAVALFVTVWLRAREAWSTSWVALLGAAAALMAMVREQDLFLAVGPAVDFLFALLTTGTLRRRGGELVAWLGTAAAGVAAFVLAYIPQLIAYAALNGVPLPASDVRRKMFWYAPHGLQVLASPEHGFLFWTPLAALAIAGLVALAVKGDDARVRRVGACALLMVGLQVYISGSVESWTVAGAFGQRRFVAVTILLTLGLSAVWKTGTATFFRGVERKKVAVPVFRRMEWGRRALAVAVGLCIWWNLALIAQFGLRLMDRQRLELRANAFHAFLTIPRMAPTLAYRYLTDRSSFYERAHGAH